MKVSRRTGSVIALLSSIAAVLATAASPSVAEETNVVKWEHMIGLAYPGSTVGPAQPFAIPWTAHNGNAWVHLEKGHIAFNVSGLVLANSTPLAAVGTIGVVTSVKGTLVCNGLSTGTASIVDTPAVPLGPQGNASFVGDVAIPTDCLLTPEKLAFLIRVATAGNPTIVDRWIAAGVVRTP